MFQIQQSAVRITILSAFVSLIVFTGCDSSEPEGGPGVPPEDIVLSEEAEILDAGAEDEVEAVSDDGRTLTFRSGSAAAARIDVGEIIIAAPSNAAPDGLLKRVESVDRGSQVVVQVRDARMEEAIEEGTIEAELTFSPDMVQGEPRMAEGARFVRSQGRGVTSNTFTVELEEVVLYDDDEDPATTTDQIRAQGVVNFTASCAPRATFQGFRLRSFRFTCSEGVDAELETWWTRPFSWEGRQLVAHFPLAPMPIAGTPFWLTPKLDVYVGADVNGEVGVSTTLTYDAELEAGLEYANGVATPISSFSHEAGYELDVTGRLAAEAYAGVPVSLLFMGVSGPYIEPETYLALEADIDADPWWQLDWGVRADAGLHTPILSGVVPDLRLENVIDERENLGQAEGAFDPEDYPLYGVWQNDNNETHYAVFTPNSLAEHFYEALDNCYDSIEAELFNIDADSFSLESSGGDREDFTYSIAAGVLYIERISDGMEWEFVRSSRDPDSFMPACGGNRPGGRRGVIPVRGAL